MIHNAWTFVQGDSNALRKQADDLEKITQASVNAYKSKATISEDEIKELEEKIQKSTDKYIKEVDAAVDAKSKEIMTV